ncbi:MAG: hypothetical protein ABIS38_09070 [Sphingomicrobium sp.]
MPRARTLYLGLLLASACPAPIAAAPVDPRLTQVLQWRELGPFRAGWASVISGAASKPDTFYFGASGGGIWKTDDSGRTWRSVFDHGPSSAIGAIAVAPSNPDVIYAGAGQPEPRYDVQSGRGVYRSSDGGKSWTDLGLHDTKYIGEIWVDPKNADHVIVAAVGHFFGASNARGLYRSTDGGRTWAHVLAPGGFTGAVDITGDPKNPQTLFAASWEGRQWPWQSYFTEASGPGSGVWRSDDGGAHWRRLGGGGWPEGPLGRISLAATRKGGALRVYAVIDSKVNGGMWRSDDGGAQWRKVNGEKAFSSYYASRITVDPRDPDVVYTVGQSIRRCDLGGARCVITRGSPGGDDYHDVWINPLHPERMAAASDQGAAISVNGSNTWSDWYNQPTGQLYHLAADNRFPYWIYSGQQDSGTVAIASRSDFGAPNFRDWHPVGGDERDYDIPDPQDPSIVYASGLGGHVTRWDANTGVVADISPFPVPNYGLRPTTVEHHFNWVNPLVAGRVGANALYLGGEVIFRTLDRGNSWAVISPDLTGKQANAPRCIDAIAIPDAAACGYGTIVAIQPSPLSPDEIWAGSDTGVLSITRDGGANWQSAMLPGVSPWSKISSIDQSYRDRATAYVAVDGQRIDDFEPHVLRTHDGGRTWREVANGLPAGQVVSVVRADPVRAGLLYAGTETGVFVSFDDGDHWQPLQRNLPTVWARDLLVKGDDLVTATQGRAIWILGDLALLRQLKPGMATTAAQLFAPAPAVHVRFNNNRDTPLPPETAIGENPPQGAVIDYWLGSSPKGPVTLEVRDSAGRAVRHFSSADRPRLLDSERYFADGWTRPQPVLSARPGLNRWIWDLTLERPMAVEYSYSIAAIWGLATPLLPHGPMVAPGLYSAVLTVDGRSHSVPVVVTADPRARNADYASTLAFSTALYAPLAKAWRGYAETEAVRGELQKRATAIGQGPLGDDTRALVARLEPSTAANSGFAGASGILAGIETSVEASDDAPSPALRATAARAIAAIDSDWSRWQAIRTVDLAALNRKLAAAGFKPVVVPTEGELRTAPPVGGIDLP